MCCEVKDKTKIKEFEDKFFNDLKTKKVKIKYGGNRSFEDAINVSFYQKGTFRDKYLYEVCEGTADHVWFCYNGKHIHLKSKKIFKYLYDRCKKEEQRRKSKAEIQCLDLQHDFLMS